MQGAGTFFGTGTLADSASGGFLIQRRGCVHAQFLRPEQLFLYAGINAGAGIARGCWALSRFRSSVAAAFIQLTARSLIF